MEKNRYGSLNFRKSQRISIPGSNIELEKHLVKGIEDCIDKKVSFALGKFLKQKKNENLCGDNNTNAYI